MTTIPENTPSAARSTVYSILICVGVGLMLARVLTVDSVDKLAIEKERRAYIDRDIAVARLSLTQKGYQGEELEGRMKEKEASIRRDAILRRPFLGANDRSRWCTVRALVEPAMRVPGVPYAIDKVIQEPNWDTIDMVKHNGHLFSSKPPLGATIVAGAYWLLYNATGMSLGEHPHFVGRTLLVLFNVLPMAIGLILLARLVERFGTTDWGRMFAMAAAVFGTFVTTFAVVLNNHLPGAVCCAIFVYFAVRIWFDDERRLRYFFGAGLAGALMATFELPSLALFAAVGLALLWKAPRQSLLAGLPAAILVAIPYFATNYISYGTLSIPYSHRTAGDEWYNYTYERNGKTYDSYWKNPQGVDRGEKSIGVYALNVLVGHHGIFSLTPIWLLSVWGTICWLRNPPDRRLRGLAALIGAVSLVCIAYFIFQPLENRNYGGNACGFRWVFWLAPLWIIAMLPAVDRISQNCRLRGLSLALLAASVFSATYPIWNPWCSPWLAEVWQYFHS